MRVRDVAVVTQGPKIRLGRLGKAIRHDDGRVTDNNDVVEGIVQMRKGAEAEAVLHDIDEKVEFLNERVLPKGVKIVPHIDRDDLVHLTTHTVLHNLTEGILLVVLVLFFFLGNLRSALIVALTIPFSLFFASILLDLRHIPANLLSLGALDFGMIVEGAAVMVENIQRRLEGWKEGHASVDEIIRSAAHEVQRPGVLRHRHHHHHLPADLHFAAGGGSPLQAHGLDGDVRVAGRLAVFHHHCARSGQLYFPQRRACLGQPHRQVDHQQTTSRPWTGSLSGVRGAGFAHCGVCVDRATWGSPASSVRNFCPISMRARSGRAARLSPSTGPTAGGEVMDKARLHLCRLSGSDQSRFAGGPLRRRHRRHRFLQHRILRRSQAAQ